MNSAIANSARREWESRPAGDYACLADHNLSPEQLAANGIGPNDPRVLRILLQCAQATPVAPRPVAAEPAQAPVSTPYNPDFVVGGLVLGGAVDPDSAGYKTYACRPSVDFPGFSWCSSHHAESGRFGPYTNWLSILHSDAYKMAQISQAVVPAFFKPGDIDREIQRLSQYFGQEARILNAEPRPGAPHATLAVWGAVTLNPLGDATLGALRRGEQIHSGLLADFVGDARKSARLGLPVYSLGGGAGYLWGADFDDSGKGSLRITAVDASALEQRPVPVPDTTARAVVPTDPLPAPTPDPALAPQEQARRDAEKKARTR